MELRVCELANETQMKVFHISYCLSFSLFIAATFLFYFIIFFLDGEVKFFQKLQVSSQTNIFDILVLCGVEKKIHSKSWCGNNMSFTTYKGRIALLKVFSDQPVIWPFPSLRGRINDEGWYVLLRLSVFSKTESPQSSTTFTELNHCESELH